MIFKDLQSISVSSECSTECPQIGGSNPTAESFWILLRKASDANIINACPRKLAQ